MLLAIHTVCMAVNLYWMLAYNEEDVTLAILFWFIFLFLLLAPFGTLILLVACFVEYKDKILFERSKKHD